VSDATEDVAPVQRDAGVGPARDQPAVGGGRSEAKPAADQQHEPQSAEAGAQRRPESTDGIAELRVTQTRSAIGSKPKQRGTLRALGLGRIGKSNTLPDRPEIRGQIAKVPHLVKVEEVQP
jgi:large subunit ribosomal protein L30